MGYEIVSRTTGRKYYPSDCVRLVNLNQVEKYLHHGATVYDIYISNKSVVFVFNREETQDLYAKWRNRELD